MLEGCLKIQLGLFYVVEMITSDEAQQPDDARAAIGYPDWSMASMEVG